MPGISDGHATKELKNMPIILFERKNTNIGFPFDDLLVRIRTALKHNPIASDAKDVPTFVAGV
jgi:hypothetical protein